MEIIECFFWGSVVLIAYTYILYPLILIPVSGFVQALRDTRYILQKNERRLVLDWDQTVAVVIAAHNEEKYIHDRIQNLLDQDYPSEKVMIYIGSDGSSDRTAEIAQSFNHSRIQVFDFKENRGKVSVLNDLMAQVSESIVVMSDANTMFEKNAISVLVRHFQNPEIGAVCGELNLVESGTGVNKDNLYWRFERVLKYHESKLGALLGANGAIYAIRRELFSPLPRDTIVDDFTVVMNIAHEGYSVKYEPEAVAIEEVPENPTDEFNRRVRIGAGNFQALFRKPEFMYPKYGWLAFSYISHKVLRWLVPQLMIVAALTNALLIFHPMYFVMALLQFAFYGLSVFAIKRNRQASLPIVVSLPAFFVYMNLALLKGFNRYIRGEAQGTWQRTSR